MANTSTTPDAARLTLDSFAGPTTPGATPVDTAASASATSTAPATAVDTVKIQFKAVGSAPILRKNKFKVGADEPFSTVMSFLRRQLQMSDSETIFCYLQSTFAPAPTQKLAELAEFFAVESELVVNYSITPAYG